MEPPWPDPNPTAPVCCPPFSVMYDFRAIDANVPGLFGYRTCFVGIPDATVGLPGGDEAFWGRLCGFGCNHCDDKSLTAMVDWEGGTRWLEPIPDSTLHNRDARGMLHDLRSDEYHLVPERMSYTRGTCWKNSGVECFGTDVCGCWGGNISSNRYDPILGTCEDGTSIWEEMHDFQTDEFFYIGDQWPPQTHVSRRGIQGPRSAYCRKFQDGRVEEPSPINESTRVQTQAPWLGGLPGKAEHLLGSMFLSASACNRNLLQHCVGPVVSNSICDTSAGNTWTRFWYNEDDVSRHRFDKLRIVSNDARIEDAPELMGDTDLASIAFKNAVLEFAKAHDFGDMTFGELDSTATDPTPSNAVGQFVKTFNADGNGPVIPGLLPNSHLAQSGCPVTVVVTVEHAIMRCDLVFTRVGPRTFPEPDTFVETHGRFHIIVWLKIEASVEGCVMQQMWRSEGDPLREQSITIGADGYTVEPNIDTIVYRDAENRVVRPGPLVEWRGLLGGNSRPTSRSQRWHIRETHLGGPICTQMADKTTALVVPAWPTLIDSLPGSPNQLYAGSVTVGALP